MAERGIFVSNGELVVAPALARPAKLVQIAQLGAPGLKPAASAVDVGSLGPDGADPVLHRFGDEFGAVVRTNMLGNASHNEQV
jgi:hypothetical protein